MMEIVIKIDEDTFKRYQESVDCEERAIIVHGTPLPKGHGRLIDEDWVKGTLDIYVSNEYNGQFIRMSDIDSIPTIIEADGGGEDEVSD